MDLFSQSHLPESLDGPLAEKLRPHSIDDFIGQDKILGQSSHLRSQLLSGKIPSMIFWGPPGSGKTTLALILAQHSKSEFLNLNAVETGSKILREQGELAHRRKIELRTSTLMFVDEIHRLNKAQQDVLLPYVEKGDLVLIGATTENPSYELNRALLSRCRLVVFERHDSASLEKMLERAFQKANLSRQALLSSEAYNRVLELADGDGRRLLNMAEQLISFNSQRPAGENTPLTLTELSETLQAPGLQYDKDSDAHYDSVSAFIKSVRGSDPDAGLYYLARMLKGGEDPVFVARRLVILASEDVGNADPRALSLAVSALQAVELVGMPEAAITLAQVTTYLSSAPKSNRSYLGLKKAEAEIDKSGSLPIPKSLRSARTREMKNLGYGADYRYSHDGNKGYVAQNFWPEELGPQKFYEPSTHGFEKNIQQYLEWLKKT